MAFGLIEHSRRWSLVLLNIQEDGVWSYWTFKKMQPKGELSMVRPIDKLVTLNPWILRQERVQDHLPRNILNSITNMVVLRTGHVCRHENLFHKNVSLTSFVRQVERIDSLVHILLKFHWRTWWLLLVHCRMKRMMWKRWLNW